MMMLNSNNVCFVLYRQYDIFTKIGLKAIYIDILQTLAFKEEVNSDLEQKSCIARDLKVIRPFWANKFKGQWKS
jgi:hypothetical protein